MTCWPRPLVFPAHQPAPKQSVYHTHGPPSSALPGPEAGPGSPAGTHMKALPAENPHGTESCPHRSPGPGSPNTGPRKLGPDPPEEKTALSHTGGEPPESTARGHGWRTQPCPGHLAPIGQHLCLAPDPQNAGKVLGAALCVCWYRWRENRSNIQSVGRKAKAEKSGVRREGM